MHTLVELRAAHAPACLRFTLNIPYLTLVHTRMYMPISIICAQWFQEGGVFPRLRKMMDEQGGAGAAVMMRIKVRAFAHLRGHDCVYGV